MDTFLSTSPSASCQCDTFSPHRPAILSIIQSLIGQYIPESDFSSFAGAILNKFESHLDQLQLIPSIDVSYALSHGLAKNEADSKLAAIINTVIYLGCDMLDNLHDGEWADQHADYSPTYVSLVASFFLSIIPTQLFGQKFEGHEQKAFLACQTVAGSLRIMATGQIRDIQSRFNPNLSVGEVEKTVLAKSGEEMALFGFISALVAGQSRSIQHQCVEFGRHLGTAIQMVSDAEDICGGEHSRDLELGTLTIPIASHLSTLQNAERELFLELWKKSGQHERTRLALLSALQESGALSRLAHVIENHCSRAKHILNVLPIHQKAHAYLSNVIDTISTRVSFYEHSLANAPACASITLMGM